DTPGFNDPVPSRDERARKSLRECDVVLILSPARQFLSVNDKDVMAKITTKNGIRELYLIPSQVDSQLFNMEITDDADGNLERAIEIIKKILTDVTKKNLSTINIDNVFNDLIHDTENRLFPTSGICESMFKTFKQKDSWDSGRKKVWENLTKNYPDYISDSDTETSKNSLLQLGNIKPVDNCIQSVKSRKNEIFREKLAVFENKYKEAAKASKTDIFKYLEDRESELKSQDIATLENEINTIQKSYNILEPELEDVFIDTVMEWYDEVKSDYESRLNFSKAEAKTGVQSSEGSRTKTWTTGWWLWKEHHSRDITTANVSSIKNSIDEFVDDYNDNLPHYLESEIYRLTKKVMQKVQGVWAERSLSNEDSLVELRNKVRSTIRDLDFSYELEYTGSSFSFDSYGSKAEGSAAEECLTEASSFVNQLNRDFKGMLKTAIDDVLKKCKNCNFSKLILDGCIKRLDKKKSDLEKPKLALENLKRIRNEVEQIKC
ncbi:MAG: hypothetical protein ACRC5H_05900, partial [Treponemataceae bacterium]